MQLKHICVAPKNLPQRKVFFAKGTAQRLAFEMTEGLHLRGQKIVPLPPDIQLYFKVV